MPTSTIFRHVCPALAAGSLALSGPAFGAVALTNTTNITLAASQVEVGGDTTDNPDVTGGLAGFVVSYTETGANDYGCCGGRGGTYGLGNLNDGDVGVGIASDGTYAIPTSGPGAVDITFGGGVQSITSIAIYNGYANRDDGAYTLKDGAGTVLGAWTISATGPGGSNDGMDSFWLTFNTPVNTNRLVIDTVVGDCCGTPSFREIQVFAVPEPSAAALLLAGLALVGRRRRAV
ncbi:MAG: PEP-CTERM sorting domain-containing protein [Verrucomicrobiales bacterium]